MPSETWMSTDGDTVTLVTDPDVEVSHEDVRAAVLSNSEFRMLGNWARDLSSFNEGGTSRKRSNGIFERDRFVSPLAIFDQMRTARDAAQNDDIVSGIIEQTEALVISGVRIECGDSDEEQVWDQILYDLDLESRLRELWRELFIYSQFYVASLWDTKSYKIEGFGEKRARRKTYGGLKVPVALSVLDPMKVVPYGDFLFQNEELLYKVSRTEATSIDEVIAGKNTTDQVVTTLLKGKADLDNKERQHLANVMGGTSNEFQYMFKLNDELVFRHTATRPDYERFAPIRMTSIFELLDLKHQLRQMDRVSLLGSTNFIVLVRKGTDAHKATAGEMAALHANVSQVARSPIIVGDHRLSVEIITPKSDNTLEPKRYNAIDSRITARLFQIIHAGGFAAGTSGDDSIKLSRIIAKGLEARRDSVKNSLERHLILPIFEKNPSLKNKPRLQLSPRQVSVDFDPNFLNMIRDLYFAGPVSTETILDVMGLDIDSEAHLTLAEKEDYKDVFKPREMQKGQIGRIAGGNKGGGGQNPDSNVANPTPRRSENDTPVEDKTTDD